MSLLDSNLYSLIQDISELFFLISILIQYLIYKKFDSKFKEVSIKSIAAKKAQKKIRKIKQLEILWSNDKN